MDPDDEQNPGSDLPELGVTEEDLRGFEYGVAASIMPVSEGWKVDYFSVPDFEREPGHVFATFDHAMEAMARVLPHANPPEARDNVRD